MQQTNMKCERMHRRPCGLEMLIVVALVFHPFSIAFPDQANSQVFNNTREVLSSAKNTSNDDEKMRILKN